MSKLQKQQNQEIHQLGRTWQFVLLTWEAVEAMDICVSGCILLIPPTWITDSSSIAGKLTTTDKKKTPAERTWLQPAKLSLEQG